MNKKVEIFYTNLTGYTEPFEICHVRVEDSLSSIFHKQYKPKQMARSQSS